MIDVAFNDIINMNIPSAIESFGTLSASEIEVAPGMLVAFEQNLQAQLYGDISHLILDFGTIYAPDTLLIRLFIFLGRICSILSDYTPDHSMTLDDLVFQFTMLAFNTSSLLNKIAAFTPSLTRTTSFQDKRMFINVFRPAGFSWVQYKTLLAHNIIEWSHCEPEACFVEDNESLLVTYQGQVNQFINGRPSTQYGSTMRDGGAYNYDIIGDFSEAHESLKEFNRGSKYNHNTKRSASTSSGGNKRQECLRDEEGSNFLNNFKNSRVLQVGETGAVFYESTPRCYSKRQARTTIWLIVQ
jgi:hypothetical protein